MADDHESSGIKFSPSLIGDIVGVLAAVAVILLSVADALKLYELEWYKHYQIEILICLVAFLIIASVVERRLFIKRLFTQTLGELRKLQPDPLSSRLSTIGLRKFYTSRDDYSKYRGAGNLQEYLRRAKKTIHIVAYWLSHGNEMEGIAEELVTLIHSNSALTVTVAIISPTSPSRESLASYLDVKVEELTSRIQSSLEKLAGAREKLSPKEKMRFALKVYDTLPAASTIMLDANEPNGKIQVDLKLYKTARQFSIGFEVERGEDGFYDRLREATLQSLDDATDFNAAQQ